MAITTGPDSNIPGQPVAAATGAKVPAVPLPRAEPELISLPSGTVLTEAQAQAMAAAGPVRLIVTAGAVDCGKTTLLSSVYELFQTGRVKSNQFAGCDTFPAFEQRCHLSRTDSENEIPETGRTPYDGPHPEYLHVKIQDGSTEENHIDFLFTDVSGEMFEHARNSTDECKRLTFLLRASHLLLFLDCEKALQPDKRWGMVQDAKSLLQSCLDSDMLESSCFVTVVWAKCDYFEATKNKAGIKEFVAGVEEDFKASFGTRIPHFKFHRAAARPTRFPNLKMGYGVRELLVDWIAHWPQGRQLKLEPPVDNGGQRESEQFAKRHNAQSAIL
jgi:Double-GTPase 2